MLHAPLLVAWFTWADEPMDPSGLPALREAFLSDAGHSLGRFWRECTFGMVDIQTGAELSNLRILPLTHETYVKAGQVESRRTREEVVAAAFAAYPRLVGGFRPKVIFVPAPSPSGATGSGLGLVCVLDWNATHNWWAHEIGHVLGLRHSSGFNGDDYTNPYCVMSGSNANPWNPPPGTAITSARFWSGYGPMPAAANLYLGFPEFTNSSMVLHVDPAVPVTLHALSQASPGQPVLAVTQRDGITWTAELRINTGWDEIIAPGGAAVVLHALRRSGDDDHAIRPFLQGVIPLTSPQGSVEPPGSANVRLELVNLAADHTTATIRFVDRYVYPILMPARGSFPSGCQISAVARTRDRIQLVGTGSDGIVRTAHWQAGGDWQSSTTAWRWPRIGGYFPAGAPVTALSRLPNQIDLFATTAGGVVHTCWWYEGQAWSGVQNNWRSLGGQFPGGAPVTALSRAPNQIDLFAVDRDGVVRTSWWYDGQDWSDWKAIGGYFPPGARVTAVSRTPNQIDLFATTTPGIVHTSWWYDGQEWSGIHNNWKPIGGFFPGGAPVTALSRTPNQIDLFATTTPGIVHTSWWYDGHDWSDWKAIGG